MRRRHAAATCRSLGDAGELLDARAKEAYRRRLAEIDEDIEEAQASGDADARRRPTRSATSSCGSCRERSAWAVAADEPASASERARAGVTRAIRQAMARIGEHHPQLGEHLDRTIRTGTYCAYLPDPRTPTRWDV